MRSTAPHVTSAAHLGNRPAQLVQVLLQLGGRDAGDCWARLAGNELHKLTSMT